jgi:hypothetical protein
MKKPEFPKVSLMLMIIFTVVGCILVSIPNLPRNIFGIDIAVFTVGYLGYIYLILACMYYAKTGK